MSYREVPGLWTIPHTAPGKCQIGGPSNAGGLFLGWVDRLVGPGDAVESIRACAGVVALHPRRTRPASRSGSPRRARRAEPDPRRRSRAAGRVRGVGIRRAPAHRDERRTRVTHRGHRRRHPRRSRGCRPSPTPRGCRWRCRRWPRAPRWVRRFSAGWRPDWRRRSPTPRDGRPPNASSSPMRRGRDPMQDRYGRFLELAREGEA